jgi:hypothetical protein
LFWGGLGGLFGGVGGWFGLMNRGGFKTHDPT